MQRRIGAGGDGFVSIDGAIQILHLENHDGSAEDTEQSTDYEARWYAMSCLATNGDDEITLAALTQRKGFSPTQEAQVHDVECAAYKPAAAHLPAVNCRAGEVAFLRHFNTICSRTKCWFVEGRRLRSLALEMQSH
jgi:hypothetical protein